MGAAENHGLHERMDVAGSGRAVEGAHDPAEEPNSCRVVADAAF